MTRHNNFDALRLIAAGMVLVAHMFPLSGRLEPLAMGQSWGVIGVLIFFSISGHLVTASWLSDPDLGRFLVKRYLRMVPGLAVAVLAMFLVVAALRQQGFPTNPLHTFNAPLWTIPLEVACYLGLAGLGMLWPRVALLFAAGTVAAWLVLPYSPLGYFALFFAAGALFQQYPILRGWRATGLCVAAGVGVFFYNDALGLALALPALVVWIGRQSWPILQSAGRFGDLSYGVYIYAWPIQQLVVAFMPGAAFAVQLVASLWLTAGAAWLSWRYVEAPALSRKPGVTSPSRLTDSAHAPAS